MPNHLARTCAINLQLFAKGCIECSGALPLSAPGPVDLPALCAGSGIAQKRQKNAEGLGRRSAFFLGGAADRRGSGQWGKVILPAHLITLLFHLGQSRVHLLYNFAHCPCVYIHSCGGCQKILFGYILALVVDHAGLFPVNAL